MKKINFVVGFFFVALISISSLIIYLVELNRASISGVDSNNLLDISLEELLQNDGKDGSKCYVAIEGQVYEITDSSLWVEGDHTTSSGRAYCGADMTEQLAAAPHGRSKLSLSKVKVVGTLKN